MVLDYSGDFELHTFISISCNPYQLPVLACLIGDCAGSNHEQNQPTQLSAVTAKAQKDLVRDGQSQGSMLHMTHLEAPSSWIRATKNSDQKQWFMLDPAGINNNQFLICGQLFQQWIHKTIQLTINNNQF